MRLDSDQMRRNVDIDTRARLGSLSGKYRYEPGKNQRKIDEMFIIDRDTTFMVGMTGFALLFMGLITYRDYVYQVESHSDPLADTEAFVTSPRSSGRGGGASVEEKVA